MGFVYLFCDPSQDLYKIGVTKNLYSKRMKQLQTGNGTELHLVAYHQTEQPYKIEKMLHTKYAHIRQHGEWFSLNKEQISSFNDTCNHLENIIKSLKENTFFK